MGVQAKRPFWGGPSVFVNNKSKAADFIRDKCKKKVLTGEFRVDDLQTVFLMFVRRLMSGYFPFT